MRSANLIKQKIKADYVANSAVINEAAQIITVKKQISFPHSNDEAITPVQLFQYQITNNENNSLFDLVLFKDVTITTKDNTIWTMPKGEIARYYKKTNSEGKIIEEKWETISYD